MNNKIKDNFKVDWVLINELAVGPAPKSMIHINKLKKLGINSILTLCDKKEATLPENIETFFNWERYVLPDHKSSRMPLIKELNNALIILAKLKLSGPVFVHCVASAERSPLVCMAWLVKKHNLTPQQALEYLMEIHDGTNPLTRQLLLLHQIHAK